ncbi:MAG: glycosyltransferase, partial [Planctomycetaceae bacterium]
LKVLDLARGGKAAALNAAVAEATGDVVCLCDANVMFRPDALGRLVEWFAVPDVGAVTGDVRLASHESDFGSGETLFYEVERQIQRGESRFGSVIGVDGGMYVVRRELFHPIAPDTLLDDFTLSISIIRQGFRIAYEPAAIATENGTPSSAAEFRRRVRVAAGSVQSLKRSVWPPLSRPVEFGQYLSHKLMRWLGPYVVLTLFIASLVLAGRGTLYEIALVAQAITGAIAAAAAISFRFRRTTLGGVPFYFVLSNLAMMVGHAKGLFDRQSVAWDRTERSAISTGVAALGKSSACGGRS